MVQLNIKRVKMAKIKRLPAEWEEQAFVQLVFPHQKTDWAPYLEDAIVNFVNIAKAIQQFQPCLIVAQNLKEVKALFEDKTNLMFVKLKNNDTWSRDFGGITIQEGKKSTILNFSFNAWGGKFAFNEDNQITQKLYKKGFFEGYGLKTYNFVLEGGAIESDGNGVIMTTSNCLLEPNRNPQFSKKEITRTLKEYLGAQKVLWLDHGFLAGDDTDAHIDTLARFANENTIIYQGCDDKNDEHYKAFKKMKKQLQTFKNVDGKPYKLVELPWIEAKIFDEERLPATYANFLIINGAVLVPTYNDKNDEKALAVFKEVFKKEKIIPIDCSTLIKQHGSLHCVTMQYPTLKGK